MATRACSPSVVVFAPSLTVSCSSEIPKGVSASPQQKRCRIVSSRLALSSPRQNPLCKIPVSRPFSGNLSPVVEIREFSRVVRSFARSPVTETEEVFFDGGTHYGDLVANLIFGLTLVWLPLTLAAVFRGLFLRYRFTNLRVTITSGLLGDDRKDFSYEVIKDVRFVPRFIGEWGDLVIELKDGTLVDLRCVPKFREIAAYVKERAGQKLADPSVLTATATSSTPKKGFSA